MKNLRYLIETRAVKLLAWLMRTLPRHVILVLAKVVGTLAYLVDYRGRDTSLENLRVAFDDTLSWTERHQITRRCYQNFARTFFDLFWFSTLTQETWREYFDLEVQPGVDLEEMRKTGSIWTTAHFGSFEMMGLTPGFMGFDFTVVAQDFKNTALTDIFTEARKASGHNVIAQQSAMLKLTKALARKGHAAFLADLSMKPSRASGLIECFGFKTCVPMLHVMLAQKVGLAVQPCLTIPKEDGRFTIKLFTCLWPNKDSVPGEVAQHCWNVLRGRGPCAS